MRYKYGTAIWYNKNSMPLWKRKQKSLNSFVKTNNGVAVGTMMCHIFESFNTKWNEATTKPQTKI